MFPQQQEPISPQRSSPLPPPPTFDSSGNLNEVNKVCILGS